MIYKNTFVLAAFLANTSGSSSIGTMESINNDGSVLVSGATGAYDEDYNTLEAAKAMIGVKANPFGNAWSF